MGRNTGHSFTKVILLVASLLSLANYTLASSRAACQKPNKEDLLKDCPPNTIVVGRGQKFTTIQSAVKSIPNNADRYTILIQPGSYREKVNITRSGPLTLLGVTSSPNDHSQNTVTVVHKNATSSGKGDNAYTSTLTVAPTEKSSLTGEKFYGYPVPNGTPFGNQDFRVYNVDFVNDYSTSSAGPSLAVSVSYANAGFYFSGIRSYQDTVSINEKGDWKIADSWQRYILANWETHTSTKGRLRARRIFCMDLVPHGYKILPWL
jgi:pectin methylesterase-like acyl-CoA thioesterase